MCCVVSAFGQVLSTLRDECSLTCWQSCVFYVQGLVKNMDVLTGNKWRGKRSLKIQLRKIKPSTRVEIAGQHCKTSKC